MSLVKWDPWREMEDMLDRYTNAVGLRLPWSGARDVMKTGDWSPRCDITETDKEFVIKVEIPEVRKEDVRVSVEDGVLSISGERNREKEEKGKTFHLVERRYGSFCRRFNLPDNTDPDGIKASFKDGMLTLALRKLEKVKPKGIEIKVE